jgi:hypothetical protein
MQSYNFINFVKIVDLSLLNFIDYMNYSNEYDEGAIMYSNEYNQLQINLNPKCRKLLTSLILNNINSTLHYGKTNIVINTCKPMQNWRQYNRKSAVRSYRYIIQDESIAIDAIKLNQWLDSLYKHLPTLNIKNFNTEFLKSSILNNIDIYKNNVKYVEFDNIDVYDSYKLLENYLKYNGQLSFDLLQYNIISDGNCEYSHNGTFTDEIKEEFHLQLLNKGII